MSATPPKNSALAGIKKVISDDRMIGPLLAVLVAVILHGLSFTPLGFANRFAPLMIVVIYSAFRGGSVPGLISSVVACCYIYTTIGSDVRFEHDALGLWSRVLSWVISFPIMVRLVSQLKKSLLEKEAARQSEFNLRK